MDINAFSAMKAYGAGQKFLTPDRIKPNADASASKGDFDPGRIVQEMAQTIAKSEAVSTEFMAGRADPHSVVEALASAELAVETAVTLRNKVVEAYQELMRMPV